MNGAKDRVDEQDIQKIKLRIKKYLELENVSVLAGAGASFHLGTPTIRDIPDDLKKRCASSIKTYFGESGNPSYEDLFNCLQADKYLRKKKGERVDEMDKAIAKMQEWLWMHCDVRKTLIHKDYANDVLLNQNRYRYHEMLIKKLLQRPGNLRRANLFTTNYDMAFDYALDNLGVHYINGFMGVHNRCFRPEVYDYDIYYPGQSVSGKVYRAEKVLRYYKLHGSLSWIATSSTPSNVYGICEVAMGKEFPSNADDQLMIYPCVSKKTFTLDLPYSEMFRQFAKAITQPQSALFCLGYSFNDEHINDIIYQALSIPSFTLIVVNYSPSCTESSSEITKLKSLGDSRIIVLDENDLFQSSFVGFVKNIMPDLYEEEEHVKLAETMSKLYEPQSKNQEAKEN